MHIILEELRKRLTETQVETPEPREDLNLLNQSLEHYKEAQKIAHEINDFSNEAKIYGKMGKVYRQLNDLEQAIGAYKESIKLFSNTSDSSEEIDAFIQLAEVQELAQRMKESKNSYEKAATIAADKNNLIKEEHCYGQMGIIDFKVENFKEALTRFEKSLKLSRRINKKKNEAFWLYYSGLCFQKLGNFKKAIDMHSDSIVVSKEISDIRIESLNYGELGEINTALNEPIAAISTYESAIMKFDFLKEKELQAKFLIRQADVYYEIGAIDKARNAYETAGRIIRKTEDKKSFENVLGKIGLAYLNEIKDYKKAIKYFSKAIEISISIKEEPDQIKWLGKLAEAEAHDFQLEISNEHYKEAIRIAEAHKDTEAKALSILGLGSNYYSQGNTEEASLEFTRALETIEKSKNESHKLTILLALSKVFLDLKNYEKALSHYKEALTNVKNLNLPNKEINILTNIGEIYKQNKQYKKALDSHNKALKIAQKLEDYKEEHTQLGNLGTLYFLQKDIQKAKEHLITALTKAKEIEDRLGRGKWTGHLGNIYIFEKNFTQAIENYEEAIKVFKKLGLRKEEIYWTNTLAAAYLEEDFENYNRSIKINTRCLELSSQVNYPEVELKITDELGQAFIAKNDSLSAINYFKKALDLSSTLKEKEKEVSILVNLANAYFSVDKIGEAIKAFERSLTLKPFVSEAEINILTGLGKCYLKLDEEERAKEYFGKSKKLISKLGEKKAEEAHYGLIGGAYGETERRKEAIEFYRKAMNLADSAKNKLKWNEKIADLLFDDQQYKKAHNEYLAIIKSVKDIKKVKQARIYARLGHTQSNIAKTKKESMSAIEFYKKGIKIARELEQLHLLFGWEKEIGDIYSKINDFESAENHFSLALDKSKMLGMKKLEQEILTSFGDLCSKKKDSLRAINYYQQALSISRSRDDSKILREKIKVLEMK